MYSMNRSVWPRSGSGAASGTIWSSFTPRLTTAFTFTGSPAAAAASMPSSTCSTGKSTSFSARKVASSSASRLTVTRSRPASASACAFGGSSEPFVVSVRSTPSAGELLDQPLEVAPHERLAAGDADLRDAERDEDAARAA